MANEVDIDLDALNLDSTANIAIDTLNFQVARAIARFDLPKIDGALIPIGKRREMRVTVGGSLIGSNYDALRTSLDTLKAELEATVEQKLTTDDDRYLMVQYQDFAYHYEKIRTMLRFRFTLLASNPFWLSETLSSDTRSPTSGVGYALTNNGNATARCKITITNNTGGALNNAIQFENTTMGLQFNYRGNLANTKVLIVNTRMDSETYVVTNDGTDDIKNFEGDFMYAQSGSNTFELTSSGAPNVSVKVEFRDTYL